MTTELARDARGLRLEALDERLLGGTVFERRLAYEDNSHARVRRLHVGRALDALVEDARRVAGDSRQQILEDHVGIGKGETIAAALSELPVRHSRIVFIGLLNSQ